jgi:hypothetical protein
MNRLSGRVSSEGKVLPSRPTALGCERATNDRVRRRPSIDVDTLRPSQRSAPPRRGEGVTGGFERRGRLDEGGALALWSRASQGREDEDEAGHAKETFS